MQITTRCEECNRVLESDLDRYGICYVELCPDCIAEAKEKGYEDGVRDYADKNP